MTKQNVTDFYWPVTLGHITRKKIYNNSPYLVFKIQDAHFGLETQEGIKDILSYLHRHFGVQYIFVEGARGEFLDFSRLRPTLKPEEITLLDTLLKEKAVTAPEYLAITSDLPITLYGVEDEEQYVKNVEALHWVSTGYKVLGQIFEELEEYVASLKTSKYSQDLLDFDRALQEYELGKLGFSDILNRWLREYDRQGRIGLEEYPTLGIFMKASELEQTIVFSRVMTESSRLLNDIIEVLRAPRVPNELFDRVILAKYQLEQRDTEEIKTLPRSAFLRDFNQFIEDILQRLVQEALKIRLGELPTREIYGSFIDLSSLCDLDIRNYPNLLKYTHYLHQLDVIKEKFLEELRMIIDETRDALFTNEDEREIDRVWRAVTGLHRLCRLESNPHECDLFIGEFGRLTLRALLEKITIIKDSKLPEKFKAWYRAALGVDALLDILVGKDGRSKQEIMIAVAEALNATSSAQADNIGLAEEAGEDDLKILTRLGEALGVHITIEQVDSDGSEILANVSEGVGGDTTGEQVDGDGSEILADLSDEPGISGTDVFMVVAIDATLEGAYKFYKMAPTRGRSLVENTLRYMKDKGIKVAALVTGGFQTHDILQILEREAVSYMVIMPTTTTNNVQTAHIDKGVYINKFGGEHHPFLQDLRRRAELLNNAKAD